MREKHVMVNWLNQFNCQIDIILGYLYMQTMTIVKGFLLIAIEHLPIAGEFRVMVINATFSYIMAVNCKKIYIRCIIRYSHHSNYIFFFCTDYPRHLQKYSKGGK
jgi:thiamine transporter ThiT